MPHRKTAEFGEVGRKVDFLMNVTNMRNAQLARALNLDASYISRIRAGKRGLPTKLPFIEPAAEFFARNVHEGYQADTLARETGVTGRWPTDKGKAGGAVSAEASGATVCVCEGRGALVASPGEHPVVYRIDEPRLAEAIAGCIDLRHGIGTAV